MPFWKGESIGRPLELGRAVGAFVREMAALDDETARSRATAAGLDEWAADNLLAYLREQREATRHVPSDRTILVERFRDELGDWRLVVHSPFGAQVNGPWALAIAARMRERRGVEVHASGATTASCCGCPTRSTTPGPRSCPPPRTSCSSRPRSSRSSSPSWAVVAVRVAVPECAARALLLPGATRAAHPAVAAAAARPQLLAVAGSTSSSR